MSESDKFFRLFGGIFFSVGVLMDVIGFTTIIVFHEWFGGGIASLLGVIFTAIGGGILIAQMKKASKVRKIKKQGIRYTGKIYGYIDDKSGTMNNAFLVNIKVHYFDEKGIEREAIVPTGFTKGSGEFPIGATIDIIALDTSYTWVKDSVRFEKIAREDELMDNKPLDPQKLHMIAVSCRNCGASFTAAEGYTAACPYCGSATQC